MAYELRSYHKVEGSYKREVRISGPFYDLQRLVDGATEMLHANRYTMAMDIDLCTASNGEQFGSVFMNQIGDIEVDFRNLWCTSCPAFSSIKDAAVTNDAGHVHTWHDDKTNKAVSL